MSVYRWTHRQTDTYSMEFISIVGRQIQNAGHRSQVTGRRSQVTGHRSQVPGRRSQVPGPRSQVPGPRSQVPGRRSQVAGQRKFNKKVRDLIRLFMFICFFHFRLRHILGDPGAVSGGGKKAKRARKKIGRRKVKKESRSPWDSSLNRPVPKPFKILACDWAQKYFLCPIRVQFFSCYFRDFLFESVHRQT